ncbi:MAG: DNA photolyase family protein [Rhizobium sp.]|nr:DNA photolyase family protein [Rhizobium sp.]
MPDSHDTPVLLWFRRNLRLGDNLALACAAESGRPVIPVYILEPSGSGNGPLGAAQSWWLHHSLQALDAALTRIGSRLILRQGHADEVLGALIAETGATHVFWNRRYDPAGIAVDSPLKEEMTRSGLTVRSFFGQLLHEPSRLKTGAGGHYRVYTPFWRALEASGEPAEPVAAPTALAAPDIWPASEQLATWALLPTKPDWAGAFSTVWTPGEDGARQRLDHFIDTGLAGYKAKRDFPALPHTSMLSPHLALGEISPAAVWHATRGLSDRVATDDMIHFRKELAWRDFSYHLLYHFPELDRENWNARFDAFPWQDAPDLLECWQRGQTGYPIVDAGMRQLWRHGTMHNRVRMIVASFLIKNLMIDWREGERWFRDTLVDADPASNAASWQWVAGSGADAAPFFRIFNPVSQGEKFDINGDYVRAFVPELKDMPNSFIHRPFEAPPMVLAQAGVKLGQIYPLPIVDHKVARNRAMAAYQALPRPDDAA